MFSFAIRLRPRTLTTTLLVPQAIPQHILIAGEGHRTMSRYAAAHKNTKGPGDARPTALQIVEDEGLIGKLTDKVFLITGVSSGIGIETMRAMYATGGHVFGTVRKYVCYPRYIKPYLTTKSSKPEKGPASRRRSQVQDQRRQDHLD
jgi:hypothetical protein